MSLFFKRTGGTDQVIPERGGGYRGSVNVTTQRAMTHSAVWACRRLRADLVSTSPVDCYRNVDGRAFSVPTPRVLSLPGGERVDITEWMYSTQMDLDGMGNTFGLITQVDGQGLPAAIELQPCESVTVRVKGGELFKYRIDGKEYDPHEVWHEKQFTSSGMFVGLSPLAYAAWTIGAYLSAQEFALDWFKSGSRPGAKLKNTAKTISAPEAASIKDRFKASVANGDVFVHGSDWDYEMIAAKASESEFLSTMKFGIGDVCRFLGVPGDMIDAESSSGSITYANVTQRNLQLLIMNLGPTITRRERALSKLLVAPRFVKLNTDAVVLRMDPGMRAEMNKVLLESGQRSTEEVREKDDLGPMTDAKARLVLQRADALGALVRAGFKPGASSSALGLPDIEHTGTVPITVQSPAALQQKSGATV